MNQRQASICTLESQEWKPNLKVFRVVYFNVKIIRSLDCWKFILQIYMFIYLQYTNVVILVTVLIKHLRLFRLGTCPIKQPFIFNTDYIFCYLLHNLLDSLAWVHGNRSLILNTDYLLSYQSTVFVTGTPPVFHTNHKSYHLSCLYIKQHVLFYSFLSFIYFFFVNINAILLLLLLYIVTLQ